MQKTAQKRSVLNKLREMTNVSGKAAEAFFNPQFKAVMEHIRKKDDQIRTFVVGKRLGDAEADPGGPALKDCLKQVKSNINRRELMTAGHDLAVFHEQVAKIVAEIKSINHKVDEVHNEFLYEKLTDEQRERLKGLKTRFAQQQAVLIKEAGIADFWQNTFTQRGRGLAAWEKRYPSKVNEIKNGLTSVFQKSESLLDVIIDALKEMASARSVRNIDNYMKGTAKIEKAFSTYERTFKDFYTKTFKKYVDDLEAYTERIAPEERTKAHQTMDSTTSLLGPQKPTSGPSITPEEAAQLSSKGPAPVSSESTLNALEKAHGPTSQRLPQSGVQPPFPTPAARTAPIAQTVNMPAIAPAPAAPADPEMDLMDRINNKSPDNADKKVVTQHRKFYSSLESLSNENPMMLALFIKKYAGSIKVTDPNTSSKLFKIAKQIKG